MPSRFETYRMKDGLTFLAERYFNPIFQDLDKRLVGLETARSDWEAAVQTLTQFGLLRLNEILMPSVDTLNAAIAEAQALIDQFPDVATEATVTAAIAHAMDTHASDPDPHPEYMTTDEHTGIRGNPHGTTAAQLGAEPVLGNPLTDGMVLMSTAGGARSWGAQGNPLLFVKADPASVAFVKTGSGTLAVKAGTQVMVGTRLVSFSAQTAVVMPSLAAGTDYAVYACTDNTVRASTSWTAPAGYTTATSRLIGGFHYGLVAPGTTLAGGGFNTTVPASPGTG